MAYRTGRHLFRGLFKLVMTTLFGMEVGQSSIFEDLTALRALDALCSEIDKLISKIGPSEMVRVPLLRPHSLSVRRDFSKLQRPRHLHLRPLVQIFLLARSLLQGQERAAPRVRVYGPLLVVNRGFLSLSRPL